MKHESSIPKPIAICPMCEPPATMPSYELGRHMEIAHDVPNVDEVYTNPSRPEALGGRN